LITRAGGYAGDGDAVQKSLMPKGVDHFSSAISGASLAACKNL